MSRVYFRVCCFLVLCTVLSFQQPLLAEQASDGLSPRKALVALVDKVHYTKLSNGLRIILYRRGVAPVFGGAVVVRVGGVDESPGHTGISHLLEHMAFKGTDTIGTRDFRREEKLLQELEELVAQDPSLKNLSDEKKAEYEALQKKLETLWISSEFTKAYDQRGAVSMNATTGKDLTTYFVNLPRPSFEFWAWIESERILRPVMRQFYRERDVVMEERRMRYDNSPGGTLYEKLLGVSYLVHPYRNPVIGYPDDISRLTASETADFHRRYYVAENIVVSVVGDVDIDRDIPVLEKHFGRIPSAGAAPSKDVQVEPEQKGERSFVIRMDASPELGIAYKKPQFPHPDDPAISIMLEILSGTKISPMYQTLVTKERVVTGVGHFEAPGQGYDNLAIFTLTPRAPHTVDEALQSFDSVLAEFKRKGVTAAQVKIAKRSLARSYLSGLTSNVSLAKDFASSELIYGDWKSLLTWYDLVMKVTPDDVNRVARQHLVPDGRTIGRIERKNT